MLCMHLSTRTKSAIFRPEMRNSLRSTRGGFSSPGVPSTVAGRLPAGRSGPLKRKSNANAREIYADLTFRALKLNGKSGYTYPAVRAGCLLKRTAVDGCIVVGTMRSDAPDARPRYLDRCGMLIVYVFLVLMMVFILTDTALLVIGR